MMGKKIVWAIIGIFVICAIAVGVLLLNINPILERFKPQITKVISDAIKAPVELGALNAQLFPSVAIEADNVSLKGSTAAEQNSVKTLILRTGLMGLLRGQATVDDLEIKGARFTITRDSDGYISVGGVPIGGAPQETSPAPASGGSKPGKEEPSAEQDQKTSINFAITEAALEDTRIVWTDNFVKPAQTVEITDLSAYVKNLSNKDFGSVEVSASALGTKPKNILISGKTSLAKTETGMPKADLVVSLANLDLNKLTALMNAYGTKVEDLQLSESLSLKSEVHIGDDGIKISPSLDAQAAGISYATMFTKPAGTRFSVDAEVHPALFGPTTIPQLNVKLGSIDIAAPLSLDAQGTLNVALTAPSVALSELNTFLPMAAPYKLGGTVSANIKASSPKGGAPTASGLLGLKDVSASVPMGEPSAGKSLTVDKVTGSLELNGETAKLPSLSAEVAGQPIQLKANVSSFAAPLVAFVLQSPKFSVSPVLAQMGNTALEGKGETEFTDLTAKGSVATKPLKGDVTISLASGQVTGIPVAATNLQVSLGNDQAILKPSTLGLFGGTIKTEGSFGLSGAQPFSTVVAASNLRLEQISNLSSSSKVKVEGLLSQADINLKGSLKAMPEQLSGVIRIVTGEGSIAGFNILGQTLGKIGSIPLLGAGLTSLIPPQYQPLITGNSTAFQSIKANVSIANQIANIEEFSLVHPIYTLSGKGTYALSGDANIHAQLRLTPILTQAMSLKEPKLKLLTDPDGSMVIPVVINLRDGLPIVLPDITDLGKRAAANTAKEAVGRAIDKVAPGLGDGASKVLNGLFK